MKDDIHRVLGYLAGVSYSLGARNRRMTTSLALEALSSIMARASVLQDLRFNILIMALQACIDTYRFSGHTSGIRGFKKPQPRFANSRSVEC